MYMCVFILNSKFDYVNVKSSYSIETESVSNSPKKREFFSLCSLFWIGTSNFKVRKMWKIVNENGKKPNILLNETQQFMRVPSAYESHCFLLYAYTHIIPCMCFHSWFLQYKFGNIYRLFRFAIVWHITVWQLVVCCSFFHSFYRSFTIRNLDLNKPMNDVIATHWAIHGFWITVLYIIDRDIHYTYQIPHTIG